MNCLPLFNTVLLVYSGIFLMNSLYFLKQSEYNYFKQSTFYTSYNLTIINLIITIILGTFFVFVQFYEYTESLFSFNDSCYGSVFFLLTGFHGFHVIVGLFFLLICLIRMCVSNNLYNIKSDDNLIFIKPYKVKVRSKKNLKYSKNCYPLNLYSKSCLS